MPLNTKISDAEWDVMEVLWQQSPICSADVCQHLRHKHGWKENTVRTLLSRLVKKGAATHQQEGKQYLFSPSVERSDIVADESGSFLQRIFRGSTKPLLVHFVQNGDLTDEEVAELKVLLEKRQQR